MLARTAVAFLVAFLSCSFALSCGKFEPRTDRDGVYVFFLLSSCFFLWVRGKGQEGVASFAGGFGRGGGCFA